MFGIGSKQHIVDQPEHWKQEQHCRQGIAAIAVAVAVVVEVKLAVEKEQQQQQ